MVDSVSLEQSIPFRQELGSQLYTLAKASFNPRAGNGKRSCPQALPQGRCGASTCLHHASANGGQGCDEDLTNRRFAED